MAIRVTEEGEGPTREPFPLPGRPPKPVPIPGEASGRVADILEARGRWLEAIDHWHKANEESAAKRFANAEFFYEESQKAVVRYFEKFYTKNWPIKLELAFGIVPDAPAAENIRAVVTVLFDAKDSLPALWLKVRRRRESITLEELQGPDWSGFSADAKALLGVTRLLRDPEFLKFFEESTDRQRSFDYFALILATVFVPLARAEMNRMRRDFDAAIDEYERLLTPYQESSSGALIWLTCHFIERPFILLALSETRMEKAEVQFKAASQGKADEARTTYQSILELFKDHGGLCHEGHERPEDAD